MNEIPCLAGARVSQVIGGPDAATASTGVGRPELIQQTGGMCEVIDSRNARVIHLLPGGEWRPQPLRIPETSRPYLRAAPILRNGRRLLLYGIRADPARSSMRWTIALCDGVTTVRRFTPEWLLGTVFEAWSVVELPDESIVVGIAATGDRTGKVRAGGLLRMRVDGTEATWVWRPGSARLKSPVGLALTPSGTLLVADQGLHLVSEVSLDGRVLQTLGTPGEPGSAGRFRSPSHATWTPRGVLVADRMNDRAVLTDATGHEVWLFGRGADPVIDRATWMIAEPTAALGCPDGDVLISDTGNGRVIRVAPDGAIVDSWGPKRVRPRLFSFPRSVEPMPNGELLVADGNHNRVVVVSAAGRVVWRYGDGIAGTGSRLHWPRSARRTRHGTVLIADGMNGRILEVDASGAVVRELTELLLPAGRRVRLIDPHDAIPLPHSLLCVDSELHAVLEIDWSGHVLWSYGIDRNGEPDGSLIDPHQAVRCDDGSTVITDPYDHRILSVAADGTAGTVLRNTLGPDGAAHPLVKCRPLKDYFGGWLTADDRGAVHFFGRDGTSWGSFGPELSLDGSEPFKVDRPRDIAVLSRSEIVVGDYAGGRLVHVELSW